MIYNLLQIKRSLFFNPSWEFLSDTFKTVFQTLLVIAASFLDEGHFVLFLLFHLRKLCIMLQFHLSKREIFNSNRVVFLSPSQPKMFSELPPKS